MVRVNFHVHTNESDGNLSPREIVEQAVKGGVTHICFTDHFWVPREVGDYKNEKRHSDKYYDELMNLRDEFINDLDILIGLEVDWIEGYENYYKRCLAERDYDFLLGSVHFLKKPDGGFSQVSYSEETVEEFGGIQNVVERYYNEMKKMIESGLMDCVSHIDLFKKHLIDKSVLNENWFKKITIEVLELMKEKKMCFEINASGWRVAGEQYPARWIIEKARKIGIPITIGNDFHKLKYGDFGEGLDEAIELARDVGYESILIFKNRKAIEVKI